MPSKNGFGNSRTPLAKKAQYGVDQKNPITMKSPLKEMDLFGLKARRNRRWAKEDAEERRQQSFVGGGRQ